MARVLSAVALAAPVVLVVSYAPPIGFFWLVLLFVLRAGWEYQRLLDACGWLGRRWDGALDAGAFLIAAWAGGPMPGLVLTLILLRLLVRSIRAETPKAGLAGAGVSLLGVLWIGGAGALIASARALPGGREAVLFLLAVVWANDVAAFYVGRAMGRRQIAPAISPAKTVEGAVGGLLGGAAAGAAFAAWAGLGGLSPIAAGTAALLLAAFAQLGDLCESLLKRAAREKDSAAFIPGHGGLLDRIDGLLLAGPPFYYFYWTLAT